MSRFFKVFFIYFLKIGNIENLLKGNEVVPFKISRIVRRGGRPLQLEFLCYSISIPIDFAVPSTSFTAASSELAFKSGIFCFAIS